MHTKNSIFEEMHKRAAYLNSFWLCLNRYFHNTDSTDGISHVMCNLRYEGFKLNYSNVGLSLVKTYTFTMSVLLGWALAICLP